MSNVPEDLRYTTTHEWVRTNEDGSCTIGITDHAQDQLGDMVFVELPELEVEIAAGDACAVVESVKAASDLYSPLDGKVSEVNESLLDSPELVNSDPFGDGWIFKLQPSDAGAVSDLMDADAYNAHIAAEEH